MNVPSSTQQYHGLFSQQHQNSPTGTEFFLVSSFDVCTKWESIQSNQESPNMRIKNLQ